MIQNIRTRFTRNVNESIPYFANRRNVAAGNVCEVHCQTPSLPDGGACDVPTMVVAASWEIPALAVAPDVAAPAPELEARSAAPPLLSLLPRLLI